MWYRIPDATAFSVIKLTRADPLRLRRADKAQVCSLLYGMLRYSHTLRYSGDDVLVGVSVPMTVEPLGSAAIPVVSPLGLAPGSAGSCDPAEGTPTPS